MADSVPVGAAHKARKPNSQKSIRDELADKAKKHPGRGAATYAFDRDLSEAYYGLTRRSRPAASESER